MLGWLCWCVLLVDVAGQIPTLQLTPQTYDGTVSITVSGTWALRNCKEAQFDCTQCPPAANNIVFNFNLATQTTCTAINNWWTPQVGMTGYNLTSIGFTYDPNPNYTSINSLGYYGGRLRIYKIPYNVKMNTIPRLPDTWQMTNAINNPSTTDCNSNTLIREYDITPLAKCPVAKWFVYNSTLPNYRTPVIPQTNINIDGVAPFAPPLSPAANTWPDTMTWFYDPINFNQIMVGPAGTEVSFPGSFCSTGTPSSSYPVNKIDFASFYTNTPSAATCFIYECNTNKLTLGSSSSNTYGFEATFDISMTNRDASGNPMACPPQPTVVTPTTQTPTTQAPTTVAPTQPPVITPCNDTHAILIQQCASFNTSVLYPSANLSFITSLFTPYLTNFTSLTSYNTSITNYTMASTLCNITTKWNTCINNTMIPKTCQQAIVNETNRVIGNTTLPNCTSLTFPITIPSCINGTRLNTTTNTCYNITTCILLCKENVIGNSTNNITQRIFYYDSDILANGSYCGILNPTQSYMGCTLPAIVLNNNYTYIWNTSMICNTTSTSWNVTIPTIISNFSCINGTWYNQNQTTIITSTMISYPNGTSIISNISTILPNITWNTNITCVIPVTTIPPTLPPSSEVTAAPTNDQPTKQDKAAGTAMALILGFSALGVGVLYWVWFRARRAKSNWQNTQQQLQSSRAQHDDIEEEEEQQI